MNKKGAAFEDKRIIPTILTAANKIKRNIKRTNLQRLNEYYKDLQLSEWIPQKQNNNEANTVV